MTSTDDRLENLDQHIKDLEVAVRELKRVNALILLTLVDSPYRALLRLMCRLELVHDWPA